jgi:hypothetical protein
MVDRTIEAKREIPRAVKPIAEIGSLGNMLLGTCAELRMLGGDCESIVLL